MSEPNQPQPEGGISSALNKKMGPFPIWLYMVVVGLGVFLFIYLRRQNSNSSSSSADNTQTVSASTRPPFINQVYTNTTPPEHSAPDQDDKNRTIQLKAAGTLSTIAERFHLTKDQLIKLNPDLANKYENTGKKVPKGTKVRVPVKDPN